MEEQKEWQHGYALDYLKGIEAAYEPYNRFSASPFAKFKKNDIAAALHDRTLLIEANADKYVGSHVVRQAKSTSPITMYPGTVIGTKQPGDTVVTHLNGPPDYVEAVLARAPGNCWLYCWAEDKATNNLARRYFSYVGSKITTFGEMHAIYFKQGTQSSGFFSSQRKHPKIDPAEQIAMKKVADCSTTHVKAIHERLTALALDFQNHYSNYNKSKSWSAVSLRGYSSDVFMIEKPAEMNDKWKAKHEGETFALQDTKLRKEFPGVEKLLSFVDGAIHRIRFMKLAPGGGELLRHTDQVDPDAGGRLGQLARLHFPIQTNPKVLFSVWEPNGNKLTVNQKLGEVWYLDTRKPHTVQNGGDTERVHLVVDAVVTEKFRKILLKDG